MPRGRGSGGQAARHGGTGGCPPDPGARRANERTHEGGDEEHQRADADDSPAGRRGGRGGVHVEVVDVRTYGAVALRAAGISCATLRRFRTGGILTPVAGPARRLLYDEAALRRARIARLLMRDLGVSLAGAGLALHLLDELAAMRTGPAAALARPGTLDGGVG